MHKQHPSANPFALMMDPQLVVQAMERSDRLARLQSRICRPLDKPVMLRQRGDLAAFDDAIDGQAESEEA